MADEQTEAVEAPAQPSAPERSQRAIAAMLGASQGESAPVEEAPPEPAPAPAVEATPEPDPVDARLEKLRQGALEHERKYREAEAEIKKLREASEAAQARAEKLRANPLDLLKENGYSLEELVRAAAKGELKPTTEADLAIERQQGAVSSLEQQLRDLQTRLQERESQELEAKQREQARARFEERGESIPVASSLDWAHEYARSEWARRRGAGEDVDFDVIASELNDSIAADFRSIALNERALKSLLADGEVRKSIQAALGLGSEQKVQPAPASRNGEIGGGNGFSALPKSAASATGVREVGGIPSDEERRMAAINAILQKG